MEARPQLKRALGAWDLTFLSVVAIANLNLVPVIAANGPTTMWLWAAALVLFLLPQGITVIELSHRFPGEGGLYIWAKEEFGDFHGFMCGWAYWTTNMFYLPTLLFYMGGILAYAGPKSVAGLADNRIFFFMLTVGLLWLTAILNIRGIGVGKWVNNSGGWGTLIGTAVLVVLAIVTVCRRGFALSAASFAVGSIDWSTMSSFGVICFGLVGLELGPVMGDEIRDPRRSVPQGVLWGGVLAGLVYVSATLALLLAVPQREVKVVQGVLQAVDKMTAGSGLTWLLPVLALVLAVAIAGSTSAWLSGSARIIYVSGIDRYLPKALGKGPTLLPYPNPTADANGRGGKPDLTRFIPAYFQQLEKRLVDLQKANIEADLILQDHAREAVVVGGECGRRGPVEGLLHRPGQRRC